MGVETDPNLAGNLMIAIRYMGASTEPEWKSTLKCIRSCASVLAWAVANLPNLVGKKAELRWKRSRSWLEGLPNSIGMREPNPAGTNSELGWKVCRT